MFPHSWQHILVNVFRETFVDVEDDALGPAQADDHQEYRDKLRQVRLSPLTRSSSLFL